MIGAYKIMVRKYLFVKISSIIVHILQKFQPASYYGSKGPFKDRMDVQTDKQRRLSNRIFLLLLGYLQNKKNNGFLKRMYMNHLKNKLYSAQF